MSLVVVALLAGLLLGRLTGGCVRALGALRLQRPALVVAALVAQAAGTLGGGPLRPVGLIASAVLAGLFLAANRGLRGTGLVALGLGANALVVGLNGAMPVSAQAAARAGSSLTAVQDGADGRHVLLTSSTRLPLLADVVPLPLPLRPEVVSPGDVLVAAGLAQLVVVAMRRSGGRRAGGPQTRALPPPASAARSTGSLPR